MGKVGEQRGSKMTPRSQDRSIGVMETLLLIHGIVEALIRSSFLDMMSLFLCLYLLLGFLSDFFDSLS